MVVDIRSSLHKVMGYLRRNEIINAFELVGKMSSQMDREFYGQSEAEVARMATIIDNFWKLHSIEPATGFTPEQLAREILK